MVDQAKILTARRAYEFRTDDLRLTTLVTSNAQEQIRQYFNFQVVQVAMPMPTFGPVPVSGQPGVPPGIVFDYGSTQTAEGSLAPIRFLHLEAQRIVVDVEGPSSAIDWTYGQLRLLLGEVRAPDGSLAVGEPERIRDYSEISARFDFELDGLISEPLRTLAEHTFNKNGEDKKVVPVSVRFRVASPSEQIIPSEIGTLSSGQMIDIRAGTRLEDRTYFSAAELPTDQHLAWLEALDQQLSQK